MKATLIALALVFCALPCLSAPLVDGAFITLEGPGIDNTAVNATISAIAGLGGHVYHVMPVRTGPELTAACLIASVPPESEAQVIGLEFTELFMRGPVAPAQVLHLGEVAVMAAEAWNYLLEDHPPGPNGEMEDDVRGPLIDGHPEGYQPQPSPRGPVGMPGNYQTSEFMIGKIAIGVVLPESTGIGENWSNGTPPSRQTAVYNAIVSGANWWATQGGTAANITFVYDTKYSVSIASEPITMPSSSEGTWIAQTMTSMGYSGATYFDQVYAYVNAIRTNNTARWGFAAFVVDSYNDVDGSWSNGGSAYAYMYGPFAVLTYDNGGWGISNFNRVFAHEMAHIFGAPDEYSGAGTCTCSTPYGYLGVLNGNCVSCTGSPATCLMRDNTLQLCSFTPSHVGWKDSDADGILDPIDTTPYVASASLNYFSQPYSSQPAITGQGVVRDYPYQSTTRTPVSVNSVSAQCYVDVPPFMPTTPTDGAFNTDYEAFNIATPPQTNGPHTVVIRATNSAGNTSTSTTALSIFIDTTPPPMPMSATILEAPYSSNPFQATVNWIPMPDPESGLASHTVSLGMTPIDPGGGYLASANVPWPLQMNQFMGVPMLHGMSYYAYVKATNPAGLTGVSVVTSPLTIDVTPPTPPLATMDGGAGTVFMNRLSFSWPPGTEDVSGITGYLLTIYDKTGLNLVTDQPVGSVTAYTAMGLPLIMGNTYFGYVKPVNGAGTIGLPSPPSNGIMPAMLYPSIPAIKQTAGMGTAVMVNNVYVSAAASSLPGVVYVEEGARNCGIRTDFTDPSVTVNSTVQVAGLLQTSPAYPRELELQNAEVEPPVGGGSKVIAPLFMNSSRLGGSQFGLQVGSTNVGLNTIGLLVRVAGNVTYASSSPPYYYTIDDGSGMLDSSSNQGVGVYCGSQTPPPTGSPYAATGISSLDAGGLPIILEL